MSGGFECLNCVRLGRCPDTNIEKLKTRHHCVKWEGAVTELVNTRNKIIQTFGHAAFPVLLKLEVVVTKEE